MSSESHEFQAEVKQLLDLMIHSLYSNRDVFLRELISNASDALDCRRFAGLTETSLQLDGEYAIRLVADPEKRTLSVEDNGIGMTRDEVVSNLGTIARSGAVEFLATLEASRKSEGSGETAPELIGQFGVGFYASFMVAERVEVLTRHAGAPSGVHWESGGDGSFTVSDAERETSGTTITLHLRSSEDENELADYTNEWVLRQIVKRYSDFVAYPIRLEVEGGETRENADEPLNSMKAIWIRPAGEVDDDELKEFYKHVSHDWNDPLTHVWARIEGTFEARGLLFVPSVAPFDLYHREMAHRGIQLYVKRVFIMDECRELMPEYLRFVKGVVDAEDLSLNVSREMLQQDAQIVTIRTHLVKKVTESLLALRRDDSERYREFWEQFGPVLKEGLLDLAEKRERIYELMLCASTHHESQLTALDDVVERMADDQETFYYLSSPSLEVARSSPHLEAFTARGIEVLLFADPIDELWLKRMPPEYRDKRWQSIDEGEIDLGSAREKEKAKEERKDEEDAFKGLIARLRAGVQNDVKEVRLSSRLTTSPACLVRDEGDLSGPMLEILKQSGREVPDVKPILEINPEHPLVERLKTLHEENGDDPRVAEYAQLLYGQAMLADGGRVDDPVEFSRRVTELMLAAL
ncbi:MAG: molecular chaperone HtpG [Myxococcales bacterium]|nr:molecular chaperone HtpG [Myxococcales bacterium]